MNKEVLTQIELNAKKFEVLSYLHLENPDLIFNVIDERDKKKNSNLIIIRSSFFKGVEPFTRKILDGFEEFAMVYMIDPTIGDLQNQLRSFNQNLMNSLEKVR